MLYRGTIFSLIKKDAIFTVIYCKSHPCIVITQSNPKFFVFGVKAFIVSRPEGRMIRIRAARDPDPDPRPCFFMKNACICRFGTSINIVRSLFLF